MHVRSPHRTRAKCDVTIVKSFYCIGEMALDVPMLVTMSIDFIIEHLFLIFAN